VKGSRSGEATAKGSATPPGASALPRLMTLAESAAALTISTRTLRALLARGAIPFVRVGARRLALRESDLSAWIAAREVQGGRP
jgi:excisionase family DNA binding protein